VPLTNMSERSEVTVEDSVEVDTPQYSPFDASEAPGIGLIVNMRIYDVLMAIYTSINADGAKELMEIHTNGGVIGSLPFFDPSLLS
jgi:hypothetical protein